MWQVPLRSSEMHSREELCTPLTFLFDLMRLCCGVVCSLKAAAEMEVEFARCIQFLSSMIKKVTLRGSFPHRKFRS